MTDTNRKSAKLQEQTSKPNSGPTFEQKHLDFEGLDLINDRMLIGADPSIQRQSALLRDTRFTNSQKEKLATRINSMQGNQYLQKVIEKSKGGDGQIVNVPPSTNHEMKPDVSAIFLQRNQEFDFSDEEGLHIEVPVEDIAGTGSGAGEREVEAEIVKLRGWVNLYLSAYRDGLNSFSDTMSFSSDEEARPRYFDVALKEVGKVLLDELINYATTGMPIVGPVVKGAKQVMTALYDEAQRAKTAGGEARIRQYIVDTRNALTEEGGTHRQLLEVMDEARPLLLSKYQAAVASSASGSPDEASRQQMIESQGSQGHLTGEAATFLQDLKSEVQDFKSHIPSAPKFQRLFTEQFADTPGLTDYISQGGEESGSLHLNMEIYREKEGSGIWSYRIDGTDGSWRLATSAPKASRLAQSLKDTIGGSVANTSLPKYLHVRVETEVDWALNDYGRAVIYFRDPAEPDYRGWDVNLSRWVWLSTHAKDKALGVSNITEDG